MPSLGNDLATIRKKHHLSVEELHEKTRIPLHILKSIEDNSIFTESDENITYIRSYIRSYAKALNIDNETIIEALDQSEIGTYNGLLIQAATGKKDKESDGEKDIPRVPKPDHQSSNTQEPAEPGESTEPLEQEKSENEVKTVQDDQTIYATKAPELDSVDWADMGRKFAPLQSRSKIWIGILFILIIVATVIFFAVYENSPETVESDLGQTSADIDQPEVIPDSLQVGIANEQEANLSSESADRQQNVQSTLSDTLNLVIYAAYGKLEPVRIYSDVMDNLYPYWIEQGQAYRFEFVNEIRIRGQYSRMELIFNGHLIENFRQQFYDGDTRMLEVTRSFFANDDKWFQAPPDSLPINAPPPQIVLDRPTFN